MHAIIISFPSQLQRLCSAVFLSAAARSAYQHQATVLNVAGCSCADGHRRRGLPPYPAPQQQVPAAQFMSQQCCLISAVSILTTSRFVTPKPRRCALTLRSGPRPQTLQKAPNRQAASILWCLLEFDDKTQDTASAVQALGVCSESTNLKES